MGAGALNGFNADQKMKQRQEFTVTLGGQKFKRAKLNGERMREVIARDADTEDDTTGTAGIAQVYQQVSLMIVDDDGSAPDPAWLEKELDFEIAAELLEALSPKGKGDREAS
jgi:hypothetical protein